MSHPSTVNLLAEPGHANSMEVGTTKFRLSEHKRVSASTSEVFPGSDREEAQIILNESLRFPTLRLWSAALRTLPWLGEDCQAP